MNFVGSRTGTAVFQLLVREEILPWMVDMLDRRWSCQGGGKEEGLSFMDVMKQGMQRVGDAW